MMLCKPVRERSEAHRRYVATVPCFVCRKGNPVPRDYMICDTVSQAAHLAFAQPRARGLKAGDQFTIPLCIAHHTSHDQTAERGTQLAWWVRHGLNPIPEAARLWAESVAAGRVKAPKVAA